MILPFWIAKEIYGWLFEETNIAYWVHIGGFLFGAVLAYASTRLGAVSDPEFLDASSTAKSSQDERVTLEKLVEEFKFDQASTVANRLLDKNSRDVAIWRTVFSIVDAGADRANEYHTAAGKLFGLADLATRDALLGEMIEDTYMRYAKEDHAKPALKNVRVLLGLGRLLAARQNLESATKITNVLLKANRQEPEMAKLLSQVSVALQKEGVIALAKHYRKELEARFPATG